MSKIKYRVVETSKGYKIQKEVHNSLFGFFKSVMWVNVISYTGMLFYSSKDDAIVEINRLLFTDKVVYESK